MSVEWRRPSATPPEGAVLVAMVGVGPDGNSGAVHVVDWFDAAGMSRMGSGMTWGLVDFYIPLKELPPLPPLIGLVKP